MRKALAIVSQHPELIDLIKEMDTLSARFEERKAFIERNAKRLTEEFEPPRKEIWKRIESYCHKIGTLPEGGDPRICFDKEADLLFVTDGSEKMDNPLFEFIKQLTDK